MSCKPTYKGVRYESLTDLRSALKEGEVFDTAKRDQDFQESLTNLKRILSIKDESNPNGVFSVDEVERILEGVQNSGETMGAFLNKTIYLASSTVRGTEYHEAFHAVFRTFLSDAQIIKYLNEAKKKFGTPTSQQLETFRQQSSTRLGLSEKNLTELWYEEKLANDFQDYATNKKRQSAFKNLWDKILKWFKNLLQNIDELEMLYNNIYQGQYKNANPVQNRFINKSLSAFSLIKTGSATLSKKGKSVRISPKDNEMINQSITNILIRKGIQNPTVEDVENAMVTLSNKFDLNNWKDALKNYKGSDKFSKIKRILDIYNSLTPSNVVKVFVTSNEALEINNTWFKSNAQDILKAVEIKLNFYSSEVFEEIEQENADDTDDGVELYAKEANKVGGFNKESKAFKQYIASASAQMDYFGLGLDEYGKRDSFPINPVDVYSGILNALKNVPKQNMWKVINKWAVHNTNGKFIELMKSDIERELDQSIDENTEYEILSQSNWFNMFVSTFHTVEDKYIQVNMEVPNKRKGSKFTKVNTFDAAQNDVADMQVSLWEGNFRRLSNMYEGNYYNFMSQNFDSLKSLVTPTPSMLESIILNAQNFDKHLTDIQNFLKNSIGVEVSKGFIEYSFVRSNEGNISNIKTDFSRKLLDDYSNYQHLESMVYLDSEFAKSFDTTILNEKNPPYEPDLGILSRIKNIAYTNAYFDGSTRPTTLQNSTGERIYSIRKPSYDYTFIQKLNDPDLIFSLKDDSPESKQEALQIIEAKFKFSPSKAKMFYHFLRNNPLIKEGEVKDVLATIRDLTPYTLSGTREEDEYTSGNGVDYAKMDKATKYLFMISMYQNSGSAIEAKGKKLYMTGVLEAKNTARAYAIPNFNYLNDDGTLTQKGFDHLYSHLENEYERIQRVKDEIKKIIDGTKTTDIIEDYHAKYYKKLDINGTVEENVRVLKDGDDFYALTYTYDENGISNGTKVTRLNNEIPNFKIRGTEFFYFSQMKGVENLKDGISPEVAQPLLQEFVNTQFDAFIEDISGPDIQLMRKKKDSDEYINQLLPNGSISMVNEDGSVNLNKLKKFFVDDYIASMNQMSLLHGDIAAINKDFVDVVKRNGSLIASGSETGEGTTKIAIIRSSEVDISELKNEPEIAEALAKNNKDLNVDSQDAQSYASTLWYLTKYLKPYAKSSPAVRNVFLKVLAGIPLNQKEYKILTSNTSALNDRKMVHKSMYDLVKTSIHVQSREKTSIPIVPNIDLLEAWSDYMNNPTRSKMQEIHKMYVPMPGYEYHHEMLNTMELNSIGIISTHSSQKAARTDVGQYNNSTGQFEISPYYSDDSNWREQVKTDNVKDKIIHGTQMMGLVWSEQNNSTIVNIDGKEVDLKQVKDAYLQMLAERISLGMNKKRDIIFKDGEVNFNRLWKYIENSLNSSSPDPQLIELFRVEGNKPVYNWNLPQVYKKLEAMYLSFVSSDTLKHKTAGTKYTLVSDVGHNVIEHNGKVITKEEYKKNPTKYVGYKTRRLQFAKKRQVGNTTVYETEVILPKRILEIYGLNVGDEISLDSDLLKQVGIRIPTQDKHSMVVMKVVDFLPSTYQTSVVMPAEIAFLSGADFDIDSLFARAFQTYKDKDGNITKYGSYLRSKNPVEDAYQEYLNYNLKNNLEFKDRYAELLNETNIPELRKKLSEDITILERRTINTQISAQELFLREEVAGEFGLTFGQFEKKFQNKIKANVNAYENGKFSEIKPITIYETNNYLLEFESRLVMNSGNINEANTKASLDLFKDAAKEFKSLGILSEEELYGLHSALDKAIASNNNDVGKDGIGPAALYNIMFQKFANIGFRFTDDITKIDHPFGISKFNELHNEEGLRINDIISTVISAMTDNAKEQIAAKFNLSTNTLAPFLTLIGGGMPVRKALLIMKQPIVIAISNEMSARRRAIKNKNDQLKEEKNKYESWESFVGRKTKGDNRPEFDIDNFEQEMVDALKGDKSLQTDLQAHIGFNFIKLFEISGTLSNFTTFIQYIKGTGTSFSEELKFGEALKKLELEVKDTLVDKVIEDNYQIVREGDKYVGYYKTPKGVRRFTIEYAGEKFINLDAAFNEDKHMFSNVFTRYVIEKDSENIFISNTQQFKNIAQATTIGLFKNLDYNFVNANTKIRDQLISFMGVKAYAHLTGQKPDSSVLTSPIIHDLMNKVGSSSMKDNPLIKFLKQKDSKWLNGNIFTIEGNTRSDQDPDFKAALEDGFTELLFASNENMEQLKALPLSQLTDSQAARLLAGSLFDYIYLKDAFQYKNGGIVKNLNPQVYKKLAKSMDVVLDLLNEKETSNFLGTPINPTYKKVFGMSQGEFMDEFINIYGRNKDNAYDFFSFYAYNINYKKDIDAMRETFKDHKGVKISDLPIKFNGDKLEINIFVNTAGLESRAQGDIIRENKAYLAQKNIGQFFEDKYSYPIMFTRIHKDEDTGKNVSKLYKITSLKVKNRKEPITNVSEMFDVDGRIRDGYATYEEVSYLSDRNVTPYALSSKELEEIAPNKIERKEEQQPSQKVQPTSAQFQRLNDFFNKCKK